MNSHFFHHNPLFFAVFFPALADGILTLVGQKQEYWSNPFLARDASPAYYVLRLSPLGFVFGSVIWFVLWYYLFKRLPQTWSIFFVFLLLCGHAWGSSSWIIKMMKEDLFLYPVRQTDTMFMWGAVVFLISLIAANATYFLGIYMKTHDKRSG